MSTRATQVPGPDYPVRITGVLDPQLRRGLWLVKWLLALPHVVVLAFMWLFMFVLTFFAGVAILFTGRYPRGLFELQMGLNRWCYRVLGYAALMTDSYPPFRLDNGGSAAGMPASAGPVAAGTH